MVGINEQGTIRVTEVNLKGDTGDGDPSELLDNDRHEAVWGGGGDEVRIGTEGL
jgi:hypothetical protein